MSKYLEKVRDMLCDELDEIAEKGELTAGNLEAVDKLTHSIKSIDTIMAMQGGYSERGYSYNYPRYYYDRDGHDYSEARRDTRGRYSRAEGHEAVREHLEMAKREASDEKTRREIQRMIDAM